MKIQKMALKKIRKMDQIPAPLKIAADKNTNICFLYGMVKTLEQVLNLKL